MNHPNVRYETRDAWVGAIVASSVGLVIVGLLVHLTAAWLFEAFKETVRREDTPLPTLAARSMSLSSRWRAWVPTRCHRPRSSRAAMSR